MAQNDNFRPSHAPGRPTPPFGPVSPIFAAGRPRPRPRPVD